MTFKVQYGIVARVHTGYGSILAG